MTAPSVSAELPAATGTRLRPFRPPMEALCNVCGGTVVADGLNVCHRHVIHELGITYRQLNYWVMQGHLKPEQRAQGSGMPRRWPATEVEVAKRMALLTAAGFAVEKAAVFARKSWPAGEIAAGVWIEVRDAV